MRPAFNSGYAVYGTPLKDFDGFTMNLETRGMIAEEFMIKEK